MDMPQVIKQVTFLIVPFAFKNDYEMIGNIINYEHWELKKTTTDRLFDHIEQLVSGKNEDEIAIGKRYIFKAQSRVGLGLPNRADTPIYFENKATKFSFFISSIELYIFETQVGFLIFKLNYPPNLGISEIVEANYHLKRFGKVRDTKVHYIKKHSKDQETVQPIIFTDLLELLIGELGVETYFEGGTSKGKEAIVYSSVFLDINGLDSKNIIPTHLFRLRRGFKDTYKPSPLEFRIAEHADILQIFENSYWGISYEGLANIVVKTNDEATDTFFSTNYFSNVEGTYLYLYILALHQKYALLYLSIQVSHLPNELKKLEEDVVEQSKLLETWRRKLVNFVLRSSYKQVSRITHHADLYEMIRKRLRIEALFNELREELDGLASLTELAEHKQRRKEGDIKLQNQELFNKGLAFISVLFLPLTVISGLFSMNIALIEKFRNGEMILLFSIIICYLITAVILYHFWISKQKSPRHRR